MTQRIYFTTLIVCSLLLGNHSLQAKVYPCVKALDECLLGGNDKTVCHCGVEIDRSRFSPIEHGIFFKLPKIDVNKPCSADNIKFPNPVVNYPKCDPKEVDESTNN